MTRNKSNSRKTAKVVRMPATKYAHLQKQLAKGANKTSRKTKKGK